jgi:hypothetical protein
MKRRERVGQWVPWGEWCSEAGTSTNRTLEQLVLKMAATLSHGVPFDSTRNASLLDGIALPPWEREGMQKESVCFA